MKKITLFCLLFGAFVAGAWSQRSDGALDEIVVIVNQQAITALDLQRRERFLQLQIKRNNQPMPSAQELSAVVLERAVLETLMLQQAVAQGLMPTDEAVQQSITDAALQTGLDLKQFLARVEQTGVSQAEYLADYKTDMAISQVREKAAANRVKVTEADVERFLKDPQSGLKQEYATQVLFLAKTEGASAEERVAQRAQAQALLNKAQATASGADFSALQAQLQAQLGNTSQAKHVVDVGFSTLDKMPQLFSDALEGMLMGGTSDVLESSAGYYVLRLSAKRSVLPQVQQTKVRHILLRVASPAEEASVTEQAKRLRDRLVLNTDLFPSLAKQFGQDASAKTGGDLGWAMPGDMVPEFEQAMDGLKVGELGAPLRSPFGWHILQVQERKMGELPQEKIRARARTLLRVRKQDEVLSDWLEQLKAQAYIEYKR